MSEICAELKRKAFHMLSLVYWAAFALLGWPRVGRWMALWLAVVFIIETARLRVPEVERVMVGLFAGIMRPTERRHFSGIVHTTAGSLAAMIIARGDPVVTGAAIGQLAFSDTAAALAGKAFGRTKIFGGPKSLEGALAGFSVGYLTSSACGARPLAALASAFAASSVELLPTTPFLNDNFWMPVASAAVLRALGAR